MAYRDDLEAAESRRADLEERLRRVRERRAALHELAAEEWRLREELDACARDVRARRAKRLPLLDRLEIASPCSARWEDMSGDRRVRFCEACARSVYDLSQMTRREAEELLRAPSGAPCVRLFRRSDGTVLTADCPVGRRRLRLRALTLSALGGGLLGAAALLGLSTTATQGGVRVAGPVVGNTSAPVVMGSAVSPPVSPPDATTPAPGPRVPMGKPATKSGGGAR